MLTFDATLTDMNGVSHPFATSGTGNALFIDSTTGQVQFYFTDDTYAGLNTVTITPVVTYSSSLSITYSTSYQFYYRLYACYDTVFQTPIDTLPEPDVEA